ncbi:MAG TPA: hypothetical protein VN345_05905 [Blastocatellia bacterium]|nr:hypothetical protein [Blastocatellia bacterium]
MSVAEEARAPRVAVAMGERSAMLADDTAAATDTRDAADVTSRERQLRLLIPGLPAGFQPNALPRFKTPSSKAGIFPDLLQASMTMQHHRQ